MILNASWSPNYNSVEGAIGMAKHYIKIKRWNNLQQGVEQDLSALIKECVKKIDKLKI